MKNAQSPNKGKKKSEKEYNIDIEKPLNHNDVYSFLKTKKAGSKDIENIFKKTTGKDIKLPFRLTKPILLSKVVYPLKEFGLEREFKKNLKDYSVPLKTEKKAITPEQKERQVYNDFNKNGVDDRIDRDQNLNGIEDKFEKYIDSQMIGGSVKELAGKTLTDKNYKYLFDEGTRNVIDSYIKSNPKLEAAPLSAKDYLNISDRWQEEMNNSTEMSKNMTYNRISEKVSNYYSQYELENFKLNVNKEMMKSSTKDIDTSFLDSFHSMDYASKYINNEKSRLFSEIEIIGETAVEKGKKNIEELYSTQEQQIANLDTLLAKVEAPKIAALKKEQELIEELKNIKPGTILRENDIDRLEVYNIRKEENLIHSKYYLKNLNTNEEFAIKGSDLKAALEDKYLKIEKQNNFDISLKTNNYKNNLQKLGITEEFLKKNKDFQEQLISGNKTKLTQLTIEQNGTKFLVDAKLSLRENGKGVKELRVHPLRKEIENNINLSPKEIEDLKKGAVLEKEIKGQTKIIQLDKEINELMKINKKDLKLPEKVNNIKLTETQKSDLKKGKILKIGDKNKRSVRLNLGKRNSLSIRKESSISKTRGKHHKASR